jgi:hypothetical protein
MATPSARCTRAKTRIPDDHPLSEAHLDPDSYRARIDIHAEVPRVDYDKLSSDRLGEPSEAVRACRGDTRGSRRRARCNAFVSNARAGTASGPKEDA